MKIFRKWLPLGVSLVLTAWVASRISMSRLFHAAGLLPWERLAAMTVGLVAALYLWDAYCLLAVFSVDGRRLGYEEVLRARGKSYLAGTLNQGLGQAAVAWDVAKIQSRSFAAMFSRSLLLSWHEGVILATAGLVGSLCGTDPAAGRARVLCSILLALLLGGALFLGGLAAVGHGRLLPARWTAWLDEWGWRRSLRLFILRSVYFAIVGGYVAAALWLCGQGIGLATALTVIPLVLIATVLPSASGLGTRESALYLLLPSQKPDVLVAMGLIWSAGVLFGRLLIGLAWLWLGGNFELRGVRDDRIAIVDGGQDQSARDRGKFMAFDHSP
jgi:hypothetical protein